LFAFFRYSMAWLLKIVLFACTAFAARLGNDAEDAVAFTPPASEDCIVQGHFLETEAAYFAALNEKDNVVNVLLEVDLSNQGSLPFWDSDNAFSAWYMDLQQKLENGLCKYPSFRSVIAKASGLPKKPHMWCPTSLSIGNHFSTETVEAEDPWTDVLGKLGEINYGPYFEKNAPRWHVNVFRYVTSDSEKIMRTKAVFVAFRSGHALADGVSLVSMLVTSVFDEAKVKEPSARRDKSLEAKPVVAEIPSQARAAKPVGIGRFDLPLEDLKQLYKKLTTMWSAAGVDVRVTLTTLLQTAVLRVLTRMKGGDGALRLAMPRDDRGAEMNRLRTVEAFKAKAASYADSLMAWNRTNFASGAAHQLESGCNGESQSLDAWKDCYLKMQKALDKRYFASAQDFIESKMSVRDRVKFYPLASKPSHWMLSSINAGPQHSTLAGAFVESTTVFLAPGSLFRRVIMIMTSGDMVSFGIMAPQGAEFAGHLKEELLNLMTWVK